MHRLLMVLALYGAMHLYCFLHVRAAFPRSGALLWVVAGFLVLMVAAPFLMFALSRAGASWASRPLAVAAYAWLAVIFWAVLLLAAFDLWNLGVKALAAATHRSPALVLAARAELAAAGIAILCAVCWGLCEAGAIRLKEITVETDRLAPGSAPVRIVQVSDLHLGAILSRGKLKKALGIVAAAEPDVLVATGDIVDGSFHGVDDEAAVLAQCSPPLGKFAVLGNHEYYAGVQGSLDFLESAGFTVLREESVLVGDRLLIAGVDDSPGHIRGQEVRADEDAALPAEEGRPATVLLKHRPIVSDASLGRFDLQLSGHTHGGQFFPFGLIVGLVYPHSHGLHEAGQGAMLYASRGAGTWGPPLRVFAPPEVTLFILSPGGSDPAGQ